MPIFPDRQRDRYFSEDLFRQQTEKINMALTDPIRAAIWAEFMNRTSAIQNTEPIAIVKADLRAAVNAVDDWCDSNQTSFNNAIPQPARNNLTARQKALILALVALRRVS
jgi:hypothetical protein